MGIKELLGKRIKNLRKERNLTQEEFSELINISQRTLSGIESGKNFLTAQTLDKILEVFKITPDDIFKLKALREPEELKKELITIIKSIPDEKIQLIYSVIDGLK